MKIENSDLYFSSISSSQLQNQTTSYLLDDNGEVLEKRTNRLTESYEQRASIRSVTSGNDTLTLSEDAISAQKSKGQVINKKEFDQDAMGRKLWLRSTLSKAAGYFDKIIKNHEEKNRVELRKFTRKGMMLLSKGGVQQKQENLGLDIAKKQLATINSLVEELGVRVGRKRPVDMIRHQTIERQESTSVSMTGSILTADERQISFSIQVGMHSEEKSETIEEITFSDPLVINFSGNSAELSGVRMSFDLDADGQDEEVATLKQGSGYLALDLNDDGVINDGRELFGPNSGSGFAELAAYDSDGNNWIDENDAIYEKLSVWMRDQHQQDTLVRLSDTGVGAIHLGQVASNFTLKSDGETLGQVKSTGVAVFEDGSVRTVQQIDLAI